MPGACSVVVVGSLNMDLVVVSHRRPEPGETLMGQTFETIPGGKGANQAVAASRLGGQVQLIGCVGDDLFGERLKKQLKQENVEAAHVQSLNSVSSGVALIQVDEVGQNAITVVPGANGLLDEEKVVEAKEVIQSADVVLLQLEIPLESVVKTIGLAKEAGVLTVVDPAPVPVADFPEELYQVDVFSPNQHEAEALTGIKVVDVASGEQAAKILQEKGARRVVVKMGDLGAVWLDEKGETGHQPAYKTMVVDTTAAGDAFTAALGLFLAEGLSLKDAVQKGCKAGSIAVSRLGAQRSMPHRIEVLT